MGNQKKILIIDGDQEFGNTITKAFAQNRYQILYANTGAAGIQKVFEYNPDLILYNIDLDPIDGYEVFKTLKASSLLNSIPVVFLKNQSNTVDKSTEMPMEGYDIFIKSKNITTCINSIQNYIQNYKITSNDQLNEFDTLFQLSPNGIIVFNEKDVIKANNFLLNVLKRNHQEPFNLKFEDIFEKSSLLKIKQWIKQYSKSNNFTFNDQVILKDKMGEEYEMSLIISEFKNINGTLQFIGFLLNTLQEKNTIVNYQLANEVCNLLRRENVSITDALEKKITQVIKLRTVEDNNPTNSFFTRRENEVLLLSMEGMSIKVIADQLSISSRTVEKYRTKLMEKSGAKNIVEVIVFSLKNNLIKI